MDTAKFPAHSRAAACYKTTIITAVAEAAGGGTFHWKRDTGIMV